MNRLGAPVVLYAEDDSINQEVMRAVIRKRPHLQTLVVGTGAEALAELEHVTPALILLDRHLPDMKGDDLLAVIRSRPATVAVPVIVISGDVVRPPVEPEGLGTVQFLAKPYNIHELLNLVDKACPPPPDDPRRPASP